MYIVLLCTSIVLTVVLWTMNLKPNIQSQYRKLLKWYSLLFLVCSLFLGVVTAQHHKEEILSSVHHWIGNHPPVNHVSANQEESMALMGNTPLIEQYQLKEKVQLDLPQIKQYPELPRGCEVTSLSMLLQYHEFETDKMTLAKEVAKTDESYAYRNGMVHFGDPNEGFVGNMYDLNQPGYGVYHEPIATLAQQYAGDRVVDFTGGSFYEIIEHVSEGDPVWVITNTLYKDLPDEYFQEWMTPNGKKHITMKEHSVVVTGYDDSFIYFNDPLTGKTKKAPKDEFQASWVQMGKQAITIK